MTVTSARTSPSLPAGIVNGKDGGPAVAARSGGPEKTRLCFAPYAHGIACNVSEPTQRFETSSRKSYSLCNVPPSSLNVVVFVEPFGVTTRSTGVYRLDFART